MRIELFNPLPATLTHYERALVSCLEGVASIDVTRVGVERHEGSLPRRLARQLATRVTAGRRDGPLVVLWPSLGLWDPPSWAFVTRRRPVLVVVHDPEPLRAQHGYGPLARRVQPLARFSGTTIVAHSTVAVDVLRAQGWDPVLLPHPVMPPEPVPRRRGGVVLVLGQHKPARSLAVLRELAEASSLSGCREIWGRGWPAVEGWAVNDLFLTEERFREVLGSARCLVLPYERFFQSGVALRALELGVPIAAARHPFLEDVLGEGWPGFVGADGWAAAVARASGVPEQDVVTCAAAAHENARGAWRSAVLGGELGRISE